MALARKLGDPNVEAKALADLGTAQVSRAYVAEGMTLLDEAMTMVLGGEASSPFAAIEVVCNLLSSCARVGDLARADQWTRVEGQVRAALAELWVLQGRLDDAERLLTGRHDHPDCLLPLAALHHARGAWADAAAVARHGVRLMGDDRVRAARLHMICVEAELALGNAEQAREDAQELRALAADHDLPVLRARTELAHGPGRRRVRRAPHGHGRLPRRIARPRRRRLAPHPRRITWPWLGCSLTSTYPWPPPRRVPHT